MGSHRSCWAGDMSVASPFCSREETCPGTPEARTPAPRPPRGPEFAGSSAECRRPVPAASSREPLPVCPAPRPGARPHAAACAPPGIRQPGPAAGAQPPAAPASCPQPATHANAPRHAAPREAQPRAAGSPRRGHRDLAAAQARAEAQKPAQRAAAAPARRHAPRGGRPRRRAHRLPHRDR